MSSSPTWYTQFVGSLLGVYNDTFSKNQPNKNSNENKIMVSKNSDIRNYILWENSSDEQ